MDFSGDSKNLRKEHDSMTQISFQNALNLLMAQKILQPVEMYDVYETRANVIIKPDELVIAGFRNHLLNTWGFIWVIIHLNEPFKLTSSNIQVALFFYHAFS